MKKEKKMKKLKNIPKFNTEDEEREFWSKHDSTDFIDWSDAKEAVFSELKPTTQAISIRLPVSLLEDIKTIANRLDVPYQSLIKVLLDESVKDKYRPAG